MKNIKYDNMLTILYTIEVYLMLLANKKIEGSEEILKITRNLIELFKEEMKEEND